MRSDKSVVATVARGVERLIGDNRRLRAEVARLEERIGRMEERAKKMAGERAALEQKIAVREVAGAIGGRSARARVDGLIRQVDRCIRLIERS